MNNTLGAFSDRNDLDASLINKENHQEPEDLASIIELHLHSRKCILEKLHKIIQEKVLDNSLVLELNQLVTDYMSCSQFAVLPPLCTRISEKQKLFFIDNGVAFSYLTNIIYEHPHSRVAVSKLIELLTDRLICEDEIFKKL